MWFCAPLKGIAGGLGEADEESISLALTLAKEALIYKGFSLSKCVEK